MLVETDATNLPRLMQCFGSRLLPRVLPDDSDPTDRDEGLAAHAMALAAFNGTPLEDMINKRAYNTFIMSAEMADYVGLYIGALNCGEMEVGTSWGTQQMQINGRADHIKWSPEYLHLEIDDFKYGYRLIEPDENWTLLSHAIGWMCLNLIVPDVVTLRIHQPRAYHSNGPIREWTIDGTTLLEYQQRIMRHLTTATDELFTGPACGKCHALPTCPAARVASMNAIDAASLPFTDAFTGAQLSSELDVLRHAERVIGERKSAVEELMKFRLRNGEPFDNYALEQQFAHTKFRKGVDAGTLRALFGIDASAPAALCTPAEFKRRGADEKLLASFTDRPVTGTKLVRVDADKRARKLLGKK